jgi:hypothetical protein
VTASQERIIQDVTDISSDDQLVSFAAAGRLAQLLRQRIDLSQGKIAQVAGLGSNSRNAGAALSAALRNRRLTALQVQRLDEVVGALTLGLEGSGGLSTLALRASTEPRSKINSSILTTRIPPGWTGAVLKESPTSVTGVLLQTSALLSAFLSAGTMDSTGRSIASIRDRYGMELEQLVQRLIHISVTPPTPRSYDAQIMLGSLASYAFEPLRNRLESELRFSPLGFRAWAAASELVKLGVADEYSAALRAWIRRLISDAEELRKLSLNAGSGLDLELAMVVPGAWSPPGDDWVREALLERAWNPEATIRERGTAALGLWQRSIVDDRLGLGETEQELRRLIAEFRDPDSRPDAAAGLRWAAATLEQAIEQRTAVCNEWPDIDEPWFLHVQEAADELDHSDLPAHLRPGAKSLFQHMILQNAGEYRRLAIETVVTSGWTEPIARALGSLLRKEQGEAWLRIRAQFALSFLQRRDKWVEDQLVRACQQAHRNLRLNEAPDDVVPIRSEVTELHASLFAIGDCFGVDGAEDRAKSARDALADILKELANLRGDQAKILRRATRAAAYVLTFTAQPREGGKKDLSQELLEKLASHPDMVTARLSQWALSFRFAPDGTIRPPMAAGVYGM